MPGTLEGDIREKLRRSGYTLTSQRRAVLEALEETRGHPSAEDIYLMVKKKNPRVALGTVYQALSVLEEVGVIGSKHWSESPTRYDLNVEPHLDIRCAGCGEVSEIPGVELGELEENIRNNTPYEITRAMVVIEGLCPACQREHPIRI
jgi:Fe2+ or Zn2+ uptake regulation protein